MTDFHWQCHWSSRNDSGNGPLRCFGSGSTSSEAEAACRRQMAASLPHWTEDAVEHAAAVTELREALADG